MSDRFDFLEFGPMPEPDLPSGALQFKPEVEVEEISRVEEMPDPAPLTWQVADAPALEPLSVEPVWTPGAPDVEPPALPAWAPGPPPTPQPAAPRPSAPAPRPKVDPPVIPGYWPEPQVQPNAPAWTQDAPGGTQPAYQRQYAPAQRTATQPRSRRRTTHAMDFDADHALQSIDNAALHTGAWLDSQLQQIDNLVLGLLGFLTLDWLFGGWFTGSRRQYASVDYVTYAIESKHGGEVHYHLVNVCKIKVSSETYTDDAEWIFSVPVYHSRRTERALDELGFEWRKITP